MLWNPTAQLRWLVLRRRIQVDDIDRQNGSWSREERVRRLQQKWVCQETGEVEWRTVPEELEWAEQVLIDKSSPTGLVNVGEEK
jgi:hypothetical protein